MQVPFSKYVGAGNDFIMIDNRENKFSRTPSLIKALCDRKRGIGADGVITVEKGTNTPFRMRIFNSDGSEAEMCGNGIRCFKRFLEELGIPNSPIQVETKERLLEISRSGINVCATMGDPVGLKTNIVLDDEHQVGYINTGVPHVVKFVQDLEEITINESGAHLRHHPHFQPEGTNVNFVQMKGDEVWVRTFERGVEGETLACGTGAVASAILASLRFNLSAPITVVPRSQEKLIVNFKIKDNQVVEVTQTGPAQPIFQGSFNHGPQNS